MCRLNRHTVFGTPHQWFHDRIDGKTPLRRLVAITLEGLHGHSRSSMCEQLMIQQLFNMIIAPTEQTSAIGLAPTDGVWVLFL